MGVRERNIYDTGGGRWDVKVDEKSSLLPGIIKKGDIGVHCAATIAPPSMNQL